MINRRSSRLRRRRRKLSRAVTRLRRSGSLRSSQHRKTAWFTYPRTRGYLPGRSRSSSETSSSSIALPSRRRGRGACVLAYPRCTNNSALSNSTSASRLPREPAWQRQVLGNFAVGEGYCCWHREELDCGASSSGRFASDEQRW